MIVAVLVSPPPVTVIVAVLSLESGFSVNVTVKVAFPLLSFTDLVFVYLSNFNYL